MAAALECWSSRASTDEDMAEHVLMRAGDRSEGALGSAASSSFHVCGGGAGGLKESSAMQKRFQKLGRNVSEAIASLKNSFNTDSLRESPAPPPPAGRTEGCRKQFWAGVVRSLTQLYPGSQLPERLVSNIRKHYDSLPLSYAQAGFEMKDVFLHIKLLEQASMEDQPAIVIQEASEDEEVHGSVAYKLTFACSSSILWPAMSGALDSASISCRKTQIFEKKGFTLGVVLLLVQQIDQERIFRTRIESALRSALKKPKNKKLPFRLCGCQEQNTPGREFGEVEDDDCGQPNYRTASDETNPEALLQTPLHSSSFVVSVNEWQTVQSGGNEIEKWLLSPDMLEFTEQLGPCTFKGVYKGKRVGIEKLKGCDKGNAYEFELRRDLLELMTCQHRSILHFFGVCIDDDHGLCVVTKLMEGGSVHDYLLKNKKIQTKEVMKIACDVAEGLQFMNDHGVSYRDLNTQKILLDKYGNACLGDMGIVAACNGGGEAMDYETDGYRWLAPEIIAGDPENVTETWMSNAYSFGMILWELVTGEEAYSSYSPVQAAVGIAACGLRPEIPKDCPQTLRSLMTKCWNNCPSKRPPFSQIVSSLTPSQQQ